jgi:hypothetical protein
MNKEGGNIPTKLSNFTESYFNIFGHMFDALPIENKDRKSGLIKIVENIFNSIVNT